MDGHPAGSSTTPVPEPDDRGRVDPRSLVNAIEAIGSDLALDQVLQRLVDSARELSGARYGALGVIAEDGSVERFVQVGRAPETVGPIGFPPQHPSMTSFLGVPIHVRGEMYGHLYLADSSRGGFSTNDQELVGMLAGAAGSAISNARLYQEARLQQQWLQATNDVHRQLLGTAGEDPLHVIARRAMTIAAADQVLVSLLTADRTTLVIEYAIGVGADELVARRVDPDQTLAASVLTSGEPLMARDAGSLDRPSLMSRLGVMDSGPILVLPLGGRPPRGVLTITRRRGRRSFTEVEMSMAAGFAAQASVSLELADARSAEQKMIMLEDRQRIARDLHDHVIQELFAVGLGLEGMAGRLGEDHPITEQLRQRVGDLDRAISRIRTSIFALQTETGSRHGLRRALLDEIDAVTPALGFRPGLTINGPVDASLSEDTDAAVLQAVRELLDRLAADLPGLTAATVAIDLTGDDVSVEVSADGGRRDGTTGGPPTSSLTRTVAGR